MVEKPRRRNLRGKKQFRIIPARLPPVALFEGLVPPEDLETLYAIEALTNDRLQAQAGNLYLVPTEDWVTGPGASIVMAAFTHIGRPSRFSDGTYGVYYAALDEATAIAETAFHAARRLRDTDEPPIELEMRAHVGTVEEALEDGRGGAFARLQDPKISSWGLCQSFGRERRTAGAAGLFYRSVRNSGGACIAAFRTRAVSRPRQGRHYRYCWNGSAIDRVLTVDRVLEI